MLYRIGHRTNLANAVKAWVALWRVAALLALMSAATACERGSGSYPQRPDAETRAKMSEAELEQLCGDGGVLKLRFGGMEFDARREAVNALESARWEQTISFVPPEGSRDFSRRFKFCQVSEAERADAGMVRLSPPLGTRVGDDKVQLFDLVLEDKRLKEEVSAEREPAERDLENHPAVGRTALSIKRVSQVVQRLESATYLGSLGSDSDQQSHYFAKGYNALVVNCHDREGGERSQPSGKKYCWFRWEIPTLAERNELFASASLLVEAGEEKNLLNHVHRLVPRLVAVATVDRGAK